MNASNSTVPQLEAYLPEGGAQVGVSDSHDSIAVSLDVHTDHLSGIHLVELSLAEATNLAAALLGAIEKCVDHQETVRIARRMQDQAWLTARETPEETDQ